MDLDMMLRKTLMSMVAMASLASVPAHAADPASAATKAAQSALAKTLPFADRQDFDFASRGYLGTRTDPIIKRADGEVVWDLNAYNFVKGDAPDTVNPSLWRQARLNQISPARS